jgi:hypothetical protein
MAQITKGTTYSTGDQVTATNLNALVDNAFLIAGAVTEQPTATAVLLTDTTLLAQGSVLRKVSIAQISAAITPDITSFLNKDGSIPVNTGVQLTLGTTNQISALNAASKGYVDATALPLTGGTLTGNLTLTTAGIITLSKNPVGALEATTKQYVDNKPGLAKAWVNFNGTVATPSTIRSSLNVSSVTKNGTGDYTVNFTTAMTDTNYAFLISASDISFGAVCSALNTTYQTTSSFRFFTASNTGASLGDPIMVCLAVFGN